MKLSSIPDPRLWFAGPQRDCRAHAVMQNVRPRWSNQDPAGHSKDPVHEKPPQQAGNAGKAGPQPSGPRSHIWILGHGAAGGRPSVSAEPCRSIHWADPIGGRVHLRDDAWSRCLGKITESKISSLIVIPERCCVSVGSLRGEHDHQAVSPQQEGNAVHKVCHPVAPNIN